MAAIHASPLPRGALLARYADAGAYTDCYTTEIPRRVTHAQYVEAFYTGGVFKLERLLLKLFLAKASTDAQAGEVAAGTIGEFAAWRVEDRTPDQLLMCDIAQRTRSWFMVVPRDASTQLFFGSAVVPHVDRATGRKRMGLPFRALLGFHKAYSRVLLAAARDRLAP